MNPVLAILALGEPSLAEVFRESFNLLDLPLLLLAYAVSLALIGAVTYVMYFVLTLPMRRNERARLFLDLLELGLKEGRTPEASVVDAARSRDQALGARFYRLAAHVEKGMRLADALAQVPRLVPPQTVAMLKAGQRVGDIAKVLPACRQSVKDGVSQVRGALNYVLVLTFVITPFSLFVPVIVNVFILPKFKEVFMGMMGGGQLPAFTAFIFDGSRLFSVIQVGFISVIWLLLLAYVGGPRLNGWMRRVLPGLPDWLQFRLPWRRKRLQRDFSAMLAVLLDAGVPETEAVKLAAESIANRMLVRRSEKVRAQLNHGVSLPTAIGAMDDSGELQWRLANALQRGRGFLRALSGWHEALDAKAFQLEQSAAQIITAGLVLLNGFIVACTVIAVFLPLIDLLNHMLW